MFVLNSVGARKMCYCTNTCYCCTFSQAHALTGDSHKVTVTEFLVLLYEVQAAVQPLEDPVWAT
jgi:hypothetical protein